MRITKFFALSLMIFFVTGCFPEEEVKEYPELESLENTLWYSYNGDTATYYDVHFDTATDGVMVGYNSEERVEEVSREEFDYTFDPVIDVVTLSFIDGASYGGILVPKGEFQISEIDVYIIQLYEVDEKGEIIYTPDGQMKSTLLFWKE